MEVEVIIPWNADGNLGEAYNRAMSEAKDWVCFLDHDILNCNPKWYHMCLTAITKVGHTAGWITGKTNSIACRQQLSANAPKNDDIMAHMLYAKQLHSLYGNKLEQLPKNLSPPLSGFMILTHREAWEKCGGFTSGFLGVDNNYYRALMRAGYSAYLMPGLYMYHIYRQKTRVWGAGK